MTANRAKTLTPSQSKALQAGLLDYSVGDSFPISNFIAVGPGLTAKVIEVTTAPAVCITCLVSFGVIPAFILKATVTGRSVSLVTSLEGL